MRLCLTLGFQPVQIVLEAQAPKIHTGAKLLNPTIARRSVQRTSTIVRGVLRPTLSR